MKKTLLISFSLLVLTVSSFAQNCPHDTSYSYKFVDGSTTKTPTSRRIYYGPQVTGAEVDRSFIDQVFKNGGYVNGFKYEFVIHQPTGGYSEYLYAEWDSASASWKPEYKESNTFSANNQLTEIITQESNQAGTLENQDRTAYTYNAKGRITSSISSKWINSAWRNTSQTTNTYQSDTLQTLNLRQSWDTTSSTWQNVQKTERTFDAAGRETSNAQFDWDANNSAWKGSYMVVRTFNQQGFQTALEELFWNVNTSSFNKTARTLYTPNASGKSTIDSLQNWNSISNTYVSSAVRLYTYNAGNELLTYRQLTVNTSGVITANFLSTRTLDAGNRPLVIFDQDSSSAGNGLWRPFRRWTYTYDANGNQLSELVEIRNPGDDTLRNNYRFTRTYNTNSKLLSEFMENWAASSVWVPLSFTLNEYNNDGFRIANEFKNSWNPTVNYYNNHTRTEYVCKAATVGINEVMQNDFKVYPNPIASGSFLNIEAFNQGKYQMLDFNGRTVKMGEVNAGVNTISTNDLSAGFYLLKLNSKTFKVIIQ